MKHNNVISLMISIVGSGQRDQNVPGRYMAAEFRLVQIQCAEKIRFRSDPV